jgi:ABC-type transporter Mla maintaining outer membrane lipid asymmetry ATPase subunit MlaF
VSWVSIDGLRVAYGETGVLDGIRLSCARGSLVAVLGLVFAAGLPAWALVRWTFNYINTRKNQDIGQVFDDAKSRVTGK